MNWMNRINIRTACISAGLGLGLLLISGHTLSVFIEKPVDVIALFLILYGMYWIPVALYEATFGA